MTTNDYINALASRRDEIHKDHATSRPFSENYEHVGLSGEFEFGKFCGLMPDVEEKPQGDSGVDFTIPLMYTVDVKTARIPNNLFHEKGKRFVDIYVLAGYDDESGQSESLGWEWGIKLQRAPTKDFGFGVMNHYIKQSDLRPMSALKERMYRR